MNRFPDRVWFASHLMHHDNENDDKEKKEEFRLSVGGLTDIL